MTPSLPKLRDLLVQLRAHQGDPQRLIALIAPYRPEQLDPIAQDCLDGYLPRWRDLLAWGVAHCAACGVRVSQAFRRAQPDALHYADRTSVFATSVGLQLGDAPRPAFGDIPSHGPGDWMLRPQDAWAEVEDSGCCGAMGTPDNTTCGVCSATLGTTFTDCYGPHWTLYHAQAIDLRWGLAPATPHEHTLAARIEAIAQTDLKRAQAVARTLPADISPQLYAELVHRIGHFGDAWADFNIPEGSHAEWRAQWHPNGRSATLSHGGHTQRVHFYQATPKRGSVCVGPAFNLSTQEGTRKARLTWYHKQTPCGEWPLPYHATEAVIAALQGPLVRSDWEALLQDLPTPEHGYTPKALHKSLNAFPWIDPAP